MALIIYQNRLNNLATPVHCTAYIVFIWVGFVSACRLEKGRCGVCGVSARLCCAPSWLHAAFAAVQLFVVLLEPLGSPRVLLDEP